MNVKSRNKFVLCFGGLLVLCLLWFVVMSVVVPRELFPANYSTLLYSREGRLLGARIAPDDQWRFPASDSLPEKFVRCITMYEDKRFFIHHGIDLLAIARALRDNFSSGRVVSGGSTLTMQLARIARGNRDRNLYEKAVEGLWALFFEVRYSKDDIMLLYSSHAPFGGNVVGLEAASWRYFGRGSSDLTWAESATLAVLPNSPSLIHPGRNRDQLKAKRDFLLKKLFDAGYIDRTDYDLACAEPLPEAPVPLPAIAPHLLDRLSVERPGERIVSTVDYNYQRQVQSIVDSYARKYSLSNHVHNVSVLVAYVESGEVLAYSGNASFSSDERHGNDVDVIVAPRSTGSILKPFLYAGLLHDGTLLPGTLVADTPLNISGFTPENYDRSYQGVVPAHRAIERSLNVPLVRMLTQYNTGRFMILLKSLGMSTLVFDEDHYGASIILGGAEGSLWDLTGMYGSMSRVLDHYRRYNGQYCSDDIHSLRLFPTEDDAPIISVSDSRLSEESLLSASAIWFTYEAMSALNRPEEEADWQQFESMKRVAWKTGTSYGGRDAWAIGTTPDYVVGVWVGNASGEGRPGMTGVGYAAPILFDVFSFLPNGNWFDFPYDETVRTGICSLSGYKASAVCEHVDTVYIPLSGNSTRQCPYHMIVHLSEDGRWRVNSSCESSDNMQTCSWFVLPPAQEYYYRRTHSDYRVLPPYRSGCRSYSSGQMEIIYPEEGAILFLPRGFSGERERFVFRAAHRRSDAVVYWHLDDTYVDKSVGRHEISVETGPGTHYLTVVDDEGNMSRVSFEVK